MPHTTEDDGRRRVAFLMPDETFRRVFDAADTARLHAEPALRLLAPYPLDPEKPAHRALLADAEIVVTGWGTPVIEGDVLAALPAVRAVAHSAGTIRPVVSDALLARGVVVASSASANAVPVAEYALAAIILAAKRAFWAADELRAGRPGHAESAWPTVGAHGVRVGVVGASHIGRLLLRHLSSLDMEVVVTDPTLDDAGRALLGVPCVPLDELIATSDVVTLHAPSLPTTHHMIDRRAIALMRPGTTLVNTARGDLVDEEALADRLERGDIAAVLDVTAVEPLPADSRLRSTPHTFLTPHIAGSQGNELRRLATHIVDEVVRFGTTGAFAETITADRLEVIA
ncbi:hydroxyacid dehydrogenase [Microbacterium gilvum]|uniref:Hydroxyacid dehydrogenase n=1 Tax=Microbacterium gilvum TaxID=1336204 RepID=A0ABP9ABU7_9MICO